MTYKDLRVIEKALEDLIATKDETIKFLTKQQKKYEETSPQFATLEREIEETVMWVGQMKAALANLRIAHLS